MSKREVQLGTDRQSGETVYVTVFKIYGGYQIHYNDLRLDKNGCWVAKEITAAGTITWKNEAKALDAARATLARPNPTRPETSEEIEMADETQHDDAALAPLRWQDLIPNNASDEMLGNLAWWYASDEEAMQMIVAELERRGVDPYA